MRTASPEGADDEIVMVRRAATAGALDMTSLAHDRQPRPRQATAPAAGTLALGKGHGADRPPACRRPPRQPARAARRPRDGRLQRDPRSRLRRSGAFSWQPQRRLVLVIWDHANVTQCRRDLPAAVGGRGSARRDEGAMDCIWVIRVDLGRHEGVNPRLTARTVRLSAGPLAVSAVAAPAGTGRAAAN